MAKYYILVVLSALVLVTSCDSDKTSEPGEVGFHQFSEDQLEHVIFPTFQKMESAALKLNESIQSQCQDIDSKNTKSNKFDRSLLQNNFRELVKAYHFSEACHIGPLKPQTAEEGSFSLSNQINWWPDDRRVKIDIEVSLIAQDPDYKFDESGYTYGIPTLEYLIFDGQLLNFCSYLSCDGTSKAWSQLSKEKKIKSRCDFMAFVSEKLVESTKEVKAAWAPPAGNTKLTRSKVYKEFLTARNFSAKLTQHLGFLESKVLTEKIGIPSGFLDEFCGEAGCPEREEYLNSGLSLLSLEHTLKGFLAVLYAGETDKNYDLIEKGRGYQYLVKDTDRAVVQRLEERVRFMLDQLNRLKANKGLGQLVKSSAKNYDPFDPYYYIEDCQASTSTKRTVEACALYADMKSITDLYLTELIPAVRLGAPKPSSGDPD